MTFVRGAIGAVVVCLVGLLAPGALAQTGGLEVTVLDQEGKPLVGATVIISHPLSYVATTGERTGPDGVAVFPVLKPGQGYKIEVTFPGLSTRVENDIRVPIGPPSKLQVQMISEVRETVKVVATGETIDLEDTSSTTRFTDDFISDLPVAGRDYQNVLTIAPGVTDSDGDGNVTVHGSRERDFKAAVGGISNVDPLTGQFMSNINPNSIEEMAVITSGAGVGYTRAQGGFADIVQKQGSNDFEGIFDFYYRSSVLDGDGATDTSNLPEEDTNWYQPSIQISGPLVKDKLWYRMSHELRDISRPLVTATGTPTIKTDRMTHSDQLTWQASPRNKLALNYNSDPLKIENYNVTVRRPTEAAGEYERTGSSYSLEWTAPYSPKVLVQSRAAWQDLNTEIRPNSRGVRSNCNLPGEIGSFYCLDSDIGTFSGSFPTTLDDHSQRLTVRSDATIYGGRFWGMSHEFKLGFAVENERYHRDLEVRPQGTLFVIRPFDEGTGAPSPDPEFLYNANVAYPPDDEVRATGTAWTLFAGDQFKPMPNLTIEVGAHIDREEISSEGKQPFDPRQEFAAFYPKYLKLVDDSTQTELVTQRIESFLAYEDITGLIESVVRQACGAGDCSYRNAIESTLSGDSNDAFALTTRRNQNIDVQNTNFSPILSVAWDPWNNGKTAFKATARRQYNFVPLLVPLQELQPALAQVAFRTSTPNDPSSYTVRGGLASAPQVQVVDRNLDTPYKDEFTFKVEREIFTETRLSVEYIHSKFKDQIQDININRATGDFGRCRRPSSSSPGTIDTSPGVGFYIDEWTGELVEDIDPGDGDGRLDDCVGDFDALDEGVGGGDGDGGPGDDRAPAFLEKPDGFLDLYTQNPFWGDIFLIGNYNESRYKAIVTEITRRQFRNWELTGSYTFSRNKSDGEDFFQAIGDDPALLSDEKGYSSNDQRHVVKVAATTVTPWGIRLGSTVEWASGLPYSVIVEEFSLDAAPVALGTLAANTFRNRQFYPSRHRNDQRNDSYWTVNLSARKEFTLGRNLNMQLSAEVFNLLNDDTFVIYNGENGQRINDINEGFYRFGREWQVGMKLAF